MTKRVGRRPRKRWSCSVGEYGQKVLVYAERNLRLYGQIAGTRKALDFGDTGVGVRDTPENRKAAKAWARDQERKLREGLVTAADPTPTAAKVFAAYHEARKDVERAKGTVCEDKRCAAMFTAVFGADRDLSKLTLGEWLHFIHERKIGAVNGSGEPVPEPQTKDDLKRRPVRPRAVEADCEWLLKVCNWATDWEDRATGQPLLRGHPLTRKRFREAVPHEANPRRPVATDDRYDAVQTVAALVHPLLPLLLALVHGTGRRIGAILALQHQDLLLAKGKDWPHGQIRWRAEEDKMGREWVAPISAEVRAALDQFLAARPAIGAVYLFSEDGERPVRYERVSKWLRRAERLAKAPKQDGSLWHAYRRGWATARKHLTAKDVAHAGGWKITSTLTDIYQQADPENTYRAVAEARPLREAQA